jgi:hypothetical protein
MTERRNRALALAQPVCRLGAARQPETGVEQGFDLVGISGAGQS